MSKSRNRLIRKPPTKRGDRIFVLTEGQKTEPQYFRLLLTLCRISPEQVIIKPATSTDPKNIVKEAKELKQQNRRDSRKGRDVELDEVWVVFDTEADRPHLREAFDQARQNGIITAVSAPSFEYWLLLHFIPTTKYMITASEVIHELKNHIPNYDKGYMLDREIKLHNIETGLRHAEQVRKSQEHEDAEPVYPSTEVDLLVKRIMSLKTY